MQCACPQCTEKRNPGLEGAPQKKWHGKGARGTCTGRGILKLFELKPLPRLPRCMHEGGLAFVSPVSFNVFAVATCSHHRLAAVRLKTQFEEYLAVSLLGDSDVPARSVPVMYLPAAPALLSQICTAQPLPNPFFATWLCTAVLRVASKALKSTLHMWLEPIGRNATLMGWVIVHQAAGGHRQQICKAVQ
jgi:hypothetical protein